MRRRQSRSQRARRGGTEDHCRRLAGPDLAGTRRPHHPGPPPSGCGRPCSTCCSMRPGAAGSTARPCSTHSPAPARSGSRRCRAARPRPCSSSATRRPWRRCGPTSRPAAPPPPGWLRPTHSTPPPGSPCTLVFLDPPYGEELLPRAVAALTAAGWIVPGSLLAAESARRDRPQLGELLAERGHGAGVMSIWRVGRPAE